MSLNYNKVILAGRLTADPELRTTPSGINCASVRIAVNRDYADKNGQTPADFLSCTAWRKTADFISKYFHKGSAILIEGALQSRTWEDPKSGKKCYATDVVAEKVKFVESKSSESQTRPAASQGYKSQHNRPGDPLQGFTPLPDDYLDNNGDQPAEADDPFELSGSNLPF